MTPSMSNITAFIFPLSGTKRGCRQQPRISHFILENAIPPFGLLFLVLFGLDVLGLVGFLVVILELFAFVGIYFVILG